MLPLGVSGAGVEVGVRVQPEHAQASALLAAVARHGADGADGQAVVAAQQDGQRGPRASFAVHGLVHGGGSSATTSGRWR
jgi:hypothetical protein